MVGGSSVREYGTRCLVMVIVQLFQYPVRVLYVQNVTRVTERRIIGNADSE